MSARSDAVSDPLAYFRSALGDELVTIGNFLAAIRYQLTAWPTLPAALDVPAASPSLKSQLSYKILGPKKP